MAIIHPDGWLQLKPTGAVQRELETLELLSKALPDTYSVCHGVHWTKIDKGDRGQTEHLDLFDSMP